MSEFKFYKHQDASTLHLDAKIMCNTSELVNTMQGIWSTGREPSEWSDDRITEALWWNITKEASLSLFNGTSQVHDTNKKATNMARKRALIARMVNEGHKKVAPVAKELGINPRTAQRWWMPHKPARKKVRPGYQVLMTAHKVRAKIRVPRKKTTKPTRFKENTMEGEREAEPMLQSETSSAAVDIAKTPMFLVSPQYYVENDYTATVLRILNMSNY